MTDPGSHSQKEAPQTFELRLSNFTAPSVLEMGVLPELVCGGSTECLLPDAERHQVQKLCEASQGFPLLPFREKEVAENTVTSGAKAPANQQS